MKLIFKYLTTEFIFKIANVILAELKKRQVVSESIFTQQCTVTIQPGQKSSTTFNALSTEMKIKRPSVYLPETQAFKYSEVNPLSCHLTIWTDEEAWNTVIKTDRISQ